MSKTVYPKTKNGNNVKLIDGVNYDSVIRNVFNKLKIDYHTDDKSNKQYNSLIKETPLTYNSQYWKLNFNNLDISQIPSFCGGGLIEGVNELVYYSDKEIINKLTDVLEYILHCRNCYLIQHLGKSVNDYITYYHNDVKEISRKSIMNKLHANQDSIFGFSYLTCNIAIDDEFDEDNNIDLKHRQRHYDLIKLFKSLGFKISNRTTNIKTGNKIIHLTLNIKDYVKTKQSTKSITRKKTQVATTI